MKLFTKSKLVAITLMIVMIFSLSGCSDIKDLTDPNGGNIQSEEDTKKDTEAKGDVDDSSDATTEDAEYSEEALAEQEAFDEYLMDSFKENVVSNTLNLHYTVKNPSVYDLEVPEATLGDYDMSQEGFEESKQDTLDDIEELEAFDYDSLTKDQQFEYDILYDYCLRDLEYYDHPYLSEPFAYISGLQTNLPINFSEYKFHTVDDARDCIALITQTPDYIDALLAFEQEKSEAGFFMSEACADEVIRQAEEYIATPEENLLIVTFNDKIVEVPDITEAEIEELKQQNYDAVMNGIIPSYQKIIDTFTDLKDTGKNDLGLVHSEGGEEYYELLFKSDSGSDKTPEEAIELIESYIDDCLYDLQIAALASYEDYESYFDAEDIYSENDLDEKETILFFEEAFADRLPEIEESDFTVRDVHPSLEGIVSPAYYITPPIDDYLNNSIYINRGTDSVGALWSTLAHEGIPGHMYQFVYYLSNDPVLLRTLISFDGYVEGWATYVEMMSYEYYDKFEEKSYEKFEILNSKLNLLVSARLDLGINYEGWDLEDTKTYLTAKGFSPDVAEGLITYIIAEPANYQKYCFGWIEFEELKTYAKDELGNDFDEKAFHTAILDAGPCPFYILRDKVDEYIENAK